MNSAQVIQQARLTTGTDASMTGFSDVDLEPILNLAYHDVWDWAVASFDEDLFYAEYKTDTVVSQAKYQINASFQKIMELWIKWDSTRDYEVITQTEETYRVDWNNYYDIQGDYITLSTAPEVAVTEWLYVKVVTALTDITASSTDAQVFPWCMYKAELQKLLVRALRPRLYMLKWQINEKQFADNDYESEKEKTKLIIRSQNGIKPTRRRSSLDSHFMN